jgi:hypothetical protein
VHAYFVPRVARLLSCFGSARRALGVWGKQNMCIAVQERGNSAIARLSDMFSFSHVLGTIEWRKWSVGRWFSLPSRNLCTITGLTVCHGHLRATVKLESALMPATELETKERKGGIFLI